MGQKGKKAEKNLQVYWKITPRGVIEKGKTRKYCSVYEYGAVKLLSELIQKHLDWPLVEYFYESANEIKAIALMKLLEDLPIKRMKQFWEKTYLSLETMVSLSPKSISSMYTALGKNLRSQYEYFNHFIKKEELYAYDLSSIFSYSENIKLAERGYNSKKVYLDQINLLMLYSIKRGAPVMLKPLPGSVRDLKSLRHELENIDTKDIVLVLDRGFASYDLPKKISNDFGDELKFILPLAPQ